MKRRLSAILLGFLIGSITALGIEYLSSLIYPPPGELDFGDSEAVTQYMKESVPLMSLIIIVVGWAIGSLLGGFASAKFDPANRTRNALVTGGLLMLLGIFMLYSFPYPTWMMIASLFVFVPFAIIGSRLVSSDIPENRPS